MPWAKGLDEDVGCGGFRCLDPARPCLDNCWLWLRLDRHEEGCAVQRWTEEWASKPGAGAREKCFLKTSPVVQSQQQLMLLFSWGLGKILRGGEVVRLQRKSIRHTLAAYLLHGRAKRQLGKGWALG
jgi:hypothetical protein